MSAILISGAVADFETIAAGVFEEHGVVELALVARAFDIPGACGTHDRGQPIDFAFRLRPEGDSVFVG